MIVPVFETGGGLSQRPRCRAQRHHPRKSLGHALPPCPSWCINVGIARRASMKSWLRARRDWAPGRDRLSHDHAADIPPGWSRAIFSFVTFVRRGVVAVSWPATPTNLPVKIWEFHPAGVHAGVASPDLMILLRSCLFGMAQPLTSERREKRDEHGWTSDAVSPASPRITTPSPPQAHHLPGSGVFLTRPRSFRLRQDDAPHLVRRLSRPAPAPFFIARRSDPHPARRLNMAGISNYARFPHMTVGENVAYGLKVRRCRRTRSPAGSTRSWRGAADG